jgi:hypothetical protein
MLQLPHDPVPLHSVATEVVAQWPPGTFLENLALDSDGDHGWSQARSTRRYTAPVRMAQRRRLPNSISG